MTPWFPLSLASRRSRICHPLTEVSLSVDREVYPHPPVSFCARSVKLTADDAAVSSASSRVIIAASSSASAAIAWSYM